MKAVVYKKYGPPDVLELREVEKPAPGDKEVLIRTRATTVTSGDWRARSLDVPAGFGLISRLVFGIRKPPQPEIQDSADDLQKEALDDASEDEVIELENSVEDDEKTVAIHEDGPEEKEEPSSDGGEKAVAPVAVVTAPPEEILAETEAEAESETDSDEAPKVSEVPPAPVSAPVSKNIPSAPTTTRAVAAAASDEDPAASETEAPTLLSTAREFLKNLKGNRVVQIQAFSLLLFLLIAFASGMLLALMIAPNNGSTELPVAVAKTGFNIPDKELQTRIVDNRILGRMFVLTGNVHNLSGESVRSISVTGRLYTKDGFFKEETVFSGNILSESELAVSELETIRNRLMTPYSGGNAAARLSPKAARPFMIVFTQIPGDPGRLDTYSVAVRDAVQ